MAQHDYIIANQSGAAFRADLNNGLAAIVSQNSGATQPSTTYAYQWWADTTAGLLKIRNAANNAWITIGTLADANLGLLSLAGGTLTGNLTLNAQSDLRLADSDSSNWVALQAPATVATNLTLTAPAADGTADQSLVTDGSGALSFASRSRLVLETTQVTTSGTSIDFTAIPSWAKRITLSMAGVSTNGASLLVVRLGDSGGFETSGYLGAATFVSGVGAPPAAAGITAHSSGFNLIGGGASAGSVDIYGALTFSLLESSTNTWACSGTLSRTAELISMFVSGTKSLSATLDRIQITSVGGTDAFDAGKANIIYEG